MVMGIEVAIEFVIAAVTALTGIILYGYSPGFTNSEGQLIISDSGIGGIALVIVGLFFFGFAYSLYPKRLWTSFERDEPRTILSSC
jgi:drug/metabolite transporter (DMT)-like permease